MTTEISGDVSGICARVSTVIDEASRNMVDRRILFELLILSLIAKEHVLFIGPPGTGKSAAVKAAADRVSGSYFEYLIGRFTEPGEIFGPLDLNALKQGEVRPVTRNMLPEANICFLDEIFLGSTAILNTLLGVLNERRYRRGVYETDVPLWTCVAASNTLPDEPMLQAFADRFLLTCFVDPVRQENLETLLGLGWQQAQSELAGGNAAQAVRLTLEDLGTLSRASAQVDLSAVQESYAHVLRKLRVGGVALSDRRLIKGQKLIAVAALLAGRRQATPADLWPIVYLVQDRDLQVQVKDLLASELTASENPMLTESVRQSSYGPEAQAAEIVAYGQTLLTERPALVTDPTFEIWQVKLESLLTRIDAGFDSDAMPEVLAVLKTGLLAAVNREDVARDEAEAAP